MNGFGWLVLLAATGQVDGTERDFGWQISADNKLEYIVQISPDKAAKLAQLDQEQLSSVPPEIAPRLSRVVVRVGTDILPRNPSIPEIERTIPLVNPGGTSFPVPPVGMPEGGRYSTLEGSGSPSATVVNGTPPALPNLQVNQIPGSVASLSDAANDLLAQTTQARTFAQDALGGASSKYLNSGTPATTPSNPTLSNPALNNPALGAAGLPAAGGNGGFVGPMPNPFGTTAGAFGNTNSATTAPNSYSQPNYGATAAGAPGLGPAPSTSMPGRGIGAAPTGAIQTGANTYNDPNSQYGQSNPATSAQPGNTYGASPSTTPNRNFGTPPLIANGSSTPNYPPTGVSTAPNYSTQPTNTYNPWPNQTYPNGTQYGQSGLGQNTLGQNTFGQSSGTGGYSYPPNVGHSSDPASLGGPSTYTGGNNQPLRVASNTGAGVTPTTGSGYPSGLAGSVNQLPAYTSPTTTGLDPYETNKKADAVLPILFVLSLVVNFYLGMLIRKLLTRYRSLLSSVRGQAV